MFEGLTVPHAGFQLIYADPPWEYRDKANAGNRGAAHKYPVMTLADICDLPVQEIAAPSCLLAMWWVPPQPREALAVVEAWGFELKTMCGFTWHKVYPSGGDFVGMGHWTRANAESVLFATRGRPKRDDASVSQIVTAERPTDVSGAAIHSAKPPAVRNRLAQLMGDVTRVELFARYRARGWRAWGNEV